jgi:hypothetical protein
MQRVLLAPLAGLAQKVGVRLILSSSLLETKCAKRNQRTEATEEKSEHQEAAKPSISSPRWPHIGFLSHRDFTIHAI